MTRLLLALGIAALPLGEDGLPSDAIGSWTVGKPYELGQPVGLDAKQEAAVIGLSFQLTQGQLAVCGKEIRIDSVVVERLSGKNLLAKYGFSPEQIGFEAADTLDVSLHELQSTKACGEFADPGTHLLMNEGRAVVEVGNEYFRLVK